MGKNINWEKITDSFRGFEKLAVEFIGSKYTNIDWKHTSETRDGNTDAIAIIMGYQSDENQPAQWWMEAKYSNSVSRLTRYRIDSTVVSAILEGTVEKVVFVTNIAIDTKTISDITEALRSASRCKEVEFYTKYSLEYWLLKHTDIYADFFQLENDELPMLTDEFIVSQEITYYNSVSDLMAFKEPQRELIIGKEYTAYVGIFASQDITLSICASSKLKGIHFKSKVNNIPLCKGENTLKFRFILKENYGYKSSKSKEIPMPVFKIGDISLIPCQQVKVLRQNLSLLNLASQNEILKKLKINFKKYLIDSSAHIVVLDGNADVGKSMILENFLGEWSMGKYSVFYREFTESIKENAQILLYMLMYILFPYIPPETIDESYVDAINITDIKQLLRDFIRYKDDHENILAYISNLLSRPSLLPNKISINRRIIVLDNMHLLDNKSAFLVSKIVCEIYEKQLPIYFVICGQTYYLDSHSYSYITEHCVFYHLNLELRVGDILSNFDILQDEKYDLTKLNFFDMNATSLLLFQKYILSENSKITNLQELVIALRVFWVSDIMERHILDYFKTILSQSGTYRILLNKIYWSCQPVNVKDVSEYESEIRYLLSNNLIKYNANGEIITSYSLYQSCFRKHFLPSHEDLNYKIGSPEDLRIKFLTAIDNQVLVECVRYVEELFEAKSYFKLDYILKDLFNSDKHMALKNILSPYEYYRLYYIYAYSAHQNGETDECEIIFQKIQHETSDFHNVELLQLSLRCLWELGVILYENMQYASVIEKEAEAVHLIEKINLAKREKADLLTYINYHDFRVLDAMIQRENNHSIDENIYKEYLIDMQNSGFYYRAMSFSARYALVLCYTDIDSCIKMLYNTGQSFLKEYGENDKHYLWCMFYYYFYLMIWNNDQSLFEMVTCFHEKMRINQYGNYRKKLYAIAAYLYSIGDISGGNQYLFQDTVFPYEARKRYQAFYYETLALHEAIKGNFLDAIGHLDSAIAFFEGIESYLFIPIHNKKVLADRRFSASKVSFLVDSKVDLSTYYIDPRSAW